MAYIKHLKGTILLGYLIKYQQFFVIHKYTNRKEISSLIYLKVNTIVKKTANSYILYA